jgi:hypothetical protein
MVAGMDRNTQVTGGGAKRITNNGFPLYPLSLILFNESPARLFAFFPLSASIVHPGLNAPNDQKLARTKSTSLSFLDINGRLYDSSMTRV